MNPYPLQWPLGYPRTPYPQHARFKGTLAQSRNTLIKEIKRMGGANIIVSTNIPHSKDGIPYANFKTPQDTGVAVYFLRMGKQMVLACDKWNQISDNIIAIAKTVEAMRGIDRWGVSEFLERSFSSFEALAAPQPAKKQWYEVLEVSPHASLETVKAVYRKLAMIFHPDKETGNTTRFIEIREAYEYFLETHK